MHGVAFGAWTLDYKLDHCRLVCVKDEVLLCGILFHNSWTGPSQRELLMGMKYILSG